MTDNLDKLIEEYSKKLMSSISKEQITKISINTVKEEAASSQEQENPPATESDESEDIPEEKSEIAVDSVQESTPEDVPEKAQINTPIPTEPPNFSTFLARVFTGREAFAVPDAKIVLYRGDILHSFLTTDENGETKRIKLESYPEENSLEPLSDEQRLNYSADVFAEGFTEQRNLLVSAVGGADIILNVELTPESEGIN